MSPWPDQDSTKRQPIARGFDSGFGLFVQPPAINAMTRRVRAFISSVFGRDRRDGLPEELDMFIKRLFEDSLLVAVRPETLRAVLFVHHGTNAVALHSFGAQKRHVGRAGL